MYESRRNSEWSPSDLTAVPTPTISRTPTLALDINNPAALEAQLLRLKERRGSDNSTTSTATYKSTPDLEQNQTSETTTTPTKQNTLSTYLTNPIKPSSKYTLTQFLLLSLATGIIDATTFSLYSVFVTKQTGNTIFLALAALQHTSVSQTEPNVAISISLFFCSAIIFGHLGRYIGSSTRLWLLVSNLISTSLIFAATALRYFGPAQRTGPFALGVIALLSIGMGAQVTVAFAAKIPDVNTTMVTGAIVQVAMDGNVFGKDNAARTRRVFFFLAMLGGAFVGAGCASCMDASLGLLVAGCVKTVVTVMFLF
ncbi:hypothetical protein D6D24_09292 [Aureobasidium pullulans]|uniref:DUF1275 domain protein n=1 Tax=Aureobasidium pullulans TaxID=5580 RepID=A0A4S8VAG2_AURPU|nr:hypothetical protein D6D28_07978 [Aureobasidium pullulans]THW08342.1 hypothetical protein D6D24_09292 [Aureobasidium pullulans]